jgi:predicted ATPase
MRATRAPHPRETLWFSRLRLENWRNFVHIETPLQRRVFLVGPNASGKSNLLDVFRFLHDIVSVGGSLEEAVRKRGGLSRLRSLAARNPSDVVVHVQLASETETAAWEYELRLSQDKRERPQIKRERVSHAGRAIVERPDAADREDPARLTQTHLQQVNVNREFRAVADFFASVRYLHIVPQLVREPDRSVGRRNDPYGGDFLELLAGTTEKTRRARLRRIRSALSLAVPQLAELALRRDSRGTPHLYGKYEHWRPQGAWQTEDQFSDGTLRLLGLLWMVLDESGPLLLEEPELSLHPDVVRFIPQMFARMQRRSGRQVMLSTHSTDLLRDEGIGLDEVLLLISGKEGTAVRTAQEFPEIKALLEGGETLAEAVMPRVRPVNPEQLALFGE